MKQTDGNIALKSTEGVPEWRHIESAPRDGSIIELMDPDCGRFAMRWNPNGHNPIFQKEYGNGIWECPGNNFTWSEDEGAGPRYWRPLSPRSSGRAG